MEMTRDELQLAWCDFVVLGNIKRHPSLGRAPRPLFQSPAHACPHEGLQVARALRQIPPFDGPLAPPPPPGMELLPWGGQCASSENRGQPVPRGVPHLQRAGCVAMALTPPSLRWNQPRPGRRRECALAEAILADSAYGGSWDWEGEATAEGAPSADARKRVLL